MISIQGLCGITPATARDQPVIIIGGQDRSYLIRLGSVKIGAGLDKRSTAIFDLIDTSQNYIPAIGEEVGLYRNRELIFAGTIDDVTTKEHESAAVNRLTVRCVDYHQLTDRAIIVVNYETDGQTLKDIVEDIVTVQGYPGGLLASEGLTTTFVSEGPEIEKAFFNYITAKECFDQIADTTGYLWYVDYFKNLYFVSRGDYHAPFAIGGTDANYIVARLRSTRQKYRNKQFVRGGKSLTDERAESFKGDGETRSFVLSFPCGNRDDNPPTIKVNTVAKTVGIRGKEEDEDAAWFWARGQNQISQSLDETVLSTSDTLEVTYIGRFPNIVQVDNEDEQAARAAIEGGTGIYAAIETDESLDDRSLSINKADELLRRFGEIPEILKVETFRHGIRPGQLLAINIPNLGINDSYLVEDVEFRNQAAGIWRTTISALSGVRFGSWVEFFAKLFAQGKPFVISEDEKLIISRRPSEDIMPADDARVVGTTDGWGRTGILKWQESAQTSMIGYAAPADVFGWHHNHDIAGAVSGDASVHLEKINWSIRNGTKADTWDIDQTTQGLMTLRLDASTVADWLDSTNAGPFIYRHVANEFDAYIEVPTLVLDTDTLFGILVTINSDSPSNWVFFGFEAGASDFRLYKRVTVSGSSVWGASNAVSAGSNPWAVRIQRFGGGTSWAFSHALSVDINGDFAFNSTTFTTGTDTSNPHTSVTVTDPVRIGIALAQKTSVVTKVGGDCKMLRFKNTNDISWMEAAATPTAVYGAMAMGFWEIGCDAP